MLIQRQLLAALIAAAVTAPALADTPAAATVEINAPRAAPALRLHEIDGVFATETGKNIVVENYGNALNVRYGRRPAKILRQTAPGEFVSADGQLAMRVERADTGGAQTVRLSMPASWL